MARLSFFRQDEAVKRYSLLLIVSVMILVALGLSLRNGLDLVSSPTAKKRVADFSVPNLRFPDRSLAASDLVGQVSLINVWATWCIPCRQEHGTLLTIARGGEVPIYGLNYKDNRKDAIRWLDQLGDPYVSTGFDDRGRAGATLGVYGVPETYVLGPDGVIAHKHIGIITDEVWKQSLLPLIRGLRKDDG